MPWPATAYHTGVWGWICLATVAPTFQIWVKFGKKSCIDYLSNFGYNLIQTDVWYKGVYNMSSVKEKLIKLIDRLSDSQIEYIFYLVGNLFGHTAD